MSRELAEKLPNWFLGNKTQEDFDRLLDEFRGKPNLKFLEIGSFCGNSAAWTIENILTDKTSTLTCIDPWNGNIVHEDFDFADVEAAFDQQLEPFKDQLIKQKSYSDEWLMNNRSIQYDFIYIDGSHLCIDCYIDLVLSWELLEVGGIIAIDDYLYKKDDKNILNSPYEGINHFLNKYEGTYILLHKSYRVFLQKI